MKHSLSKLAAAAVLALCSLASPSAHAQALQPATPLVFDADDLRATDPLDAMGRAHHDHLVALNAGTSVVVRMNSRDFDALVTVTGPDGFHAENDDGVEAGTDSELRFVAPAAGIYTVTATSYAPGNYGGYLLMVTPQGVGAAPAPQTPVAPTPALEAPPPVAQRPAFEPAAEPSSAEGRLYGVFVGVTHYPSNNEIYRGAEDAADLGGAFAQSGRVRRGDAVVLTDAGVTSGAIRNAITLLATRMNARDTLLFYFGGHGGEGTLSLPSGSLTADELGAMLDRVPGRSVVALDTCHAGSFRSMVEGAPQRVGFFSSRADETSYTAESVHASGWLIYFLIHAARGEAPMGADGRLQTRELTDYVRRGYRAHHAPQTLVVAAGPGARDATLW